VSSRASAGGRRAGNQNLVIHRLQQRHEQQQFLATLTEAEPVHVMNDRPAAGLNPRPSLTLQEVGTGPNCGICGASGGCCTCSTKPAAAAKASVHNPYAPKPKGKVSGSFVPPRPHTSSGGSALGGSSSTAQQKAFFSQPKQPAAAAAKPARQQQQQQQLGNPWDRKQAHSGKSNAQQQQQQQQKKRPATAPPDANSLSAWSADFTETDIVYKKRAASSNNSSKSSNGISNSSKTSSSNFFSPRDGRQQDVDDDADAGDGPQIDLAAAQTWIYPSNYPVREYQKQIVTRALFSNTLVSLPTGLGKTLIAAVVMYNFYRWFPDGKVSC
jgi:hypothetical protein